MVSLAGIIGWSAGGVGRPRSRVIPRTGWRPFGRKLLSGAMIMRSRNAVAASRRRHRIACGAQPETVDAGAAVGFAEHRIRISVPTIKSGRAMVGGVGDVVATPLA